MSEFKTGTIIDGRYRVLSRLGAGGMADVYLAKDEQLDREVALKLLHRRFAEDPGFVERFRREAQAAASLQHPNVVSIFDRGSFEDTYYIAMEYLQGRTLKQVIREQAPLDINRAIDIAVQMLKAARFAHRRGVIHRDLKPHNVMVDDNDHVKVTDFGIARAGASDMTETGSIMGTAQYLSPEQAQGLAVSAPSDLYSIAVVLYEMLTGRVPFDGELPVSIALKHVSEAPTPPSEINPAVPSALEQVVMWSLNKDPADRPADADQFIMALEQVRDALAASPGEVTASMRALSLSPGGMLPAVGYQHTGVMPAADALSAYGTATHPYGPRRLDGYDDDHGDGGGSPIWPWIVGIVVVLLLAGGGVTAYLLTRPHKVSVPYVKNLQFSVAQSRIQALGLVVVEDPQPSQQSANTVIGQNPGGGTNVKRGSTVTLNVSTGPQQVTVPTVESETQAQATRDLKAAGLKVSSVIKQASQTVTAGNVIGTQPGGGSNVARGYGVVLVVSSGLSVPGVVGDSYANAQQTLSQFNVTTTPQTSTTQSAGTVLGQTPAAGQPVGKDGTVTLTIAQSPKTLQVPNVLGDTQNGAVRTLQQAGFAVKVVSGNTTNVVEVGTVIKQGPQGSANAKPGATVTITIGQLAPTTTTNTAPTNTSPGGTTPVPPAS